ncbi:hypothetical protein PJ985_03170 [Streptomyces sp. ACA25]|uniref:hypothetical protein n=1 Tax=Streptomyces sp. ACA25 TaxID=3022596 RepID=UPI002307CF86|nr:hypothetical protein [Streptomyces sp. ACA25]MDB1086567.1 hypothetical protein [Streptomyces sp. ACA25]
MTGRLRILGVVLGLIGAVFLVAGGVAYSQVQDGYGSLQSFSEVQDVNLTYNDEGQLIDRGTTEGADAIRQLLEEDWGYPVVESDLDPDDPLVNTATEYMYQMATVGYHVLNGTHTVELEEAVEYNGETFEAGTHEFNIDGRYWNDFDREHPIEGPAREMAWTGTVHGLFGELGVGTVTHSALQMGLALAGLFAGIGVTLVIAGGGVVWVSYGRRRTEAKEPAAA